MWDEVNTESSQGVVIPFLLPFGTAVYWGWLLCMGEKAGFLTLKCRRVRREVFRGSGPVRGRGSSRVN